jgi:hypothetical protein
MVVNQDLVGKQGGRMTSFEEDAKVSARELQNGEFTVALFNHGDEAQEIDASFKSLSNTTRFEITEMCQYNNMGVFAHQFVATNVSAHDTVMLSVKPVR